MLELEVPGPPQAKERPRRGRGGHFYTPSRTRAAEEQLAMVLRSKRTHFFGPVRVTLDFYVTGWKGDGDNFEKLVLDSLQKGDVIKNDKQVMECSWTIHEELPERTMIRVEDLVFEDGSR